MGGGSGQGSAGEAPVRTRELLAAPLPSHIPAEIDAEIRKRFPIHVQQRVY